MPDGRERQHKRFHGEKEELLRLRQLLEPGDGPVPPWGLRLEGYDLDLVDRRREDLASEPEKIQREEDSEPEPEKSHWEEGSDSEPEPEPEPEKIQGEEDSQPTPPTEPEKISEGRSAKAPLEVGRDECGDWISRSGWTVAPYYRDPDPEAPQYFDDMAKFYLEAARRLPIAQMPELAGVLSRGGLLFGFNDPVTNIIVNSIYLMEKSTSDFGVLPRGTHPLQHAANRASYVDIARRSRAALVVFMVIYFRHLTEAQAKRYLGAARQDLVSAMMLVESHRAEAPDRFLLGNKFRLLPDSKRTKTAVRYAANAAMLLHDPDDLVRLLTSKFPLQLLVPALNDVCRGELLSVSRVNDILDLLRHPWSPPPPLPAPSPGIFEDANGNTTMIMNLRGLFYTTTITKDRVAAFIKGDGNQNGDIVTTTTISSHPSHREVDDMVAQIAYLSSCTTNEERKLFCLNAIQEVKHDMNLVMMCLLDTMHGIYIQALAMLPSDHQPRLLHAVLAAGHCYGIMSNPVHNIIINSIWYKLNYLPPEDETIQIHHRSMTRIVSCSLHGLIAFVLNTFFSSPEDLFTISTEQEAVVFLKEHDCFLTNYTLETKSILAAAQAAKHPQSAAFIEFMECLIPHVNMLNSMMPIAKCLSKYDFDAIHKIIADISAPVPRTPDLCQLALMDSDCWVQPYVRKRLEELLLNYGCKDPSVKRPQYKLGIICGVASKIFSLYHGDITCYHANFLASSEAYGCSLFFAEFWDRADDNFEQSKRPPVCCPVSHMNQFLYTEHQCLCRCFICESDAIRVVHPSNVDYFMGHVVPTDALCAVAEHEYALGGMKVEFKNRL